VWSLNRPRHEPGVVLRRDLESGSVDDAACVCSKLSETLKEMLTGDIAALEGDWLDVGVVDDEGGGV